MALDRTLAALVRHDDLDVSARGGRTHRRAGEQRGLWKAWRARELARRDQDPVRYFSGRLRTTAKSHFFRGTARAARAARAMRSAGTGAGHGRRLRSTAQNAAPEPQI